MGKTLHWIKGRNARGRMLAVTPLSFALLASSRSKNQNRKSRHQSHNRLLPSTESFKLKIKTKSSTIQNFASPSLSRMRGGATPRPPDNHLIEGVSISCGPSRQDLVFLALPSIPKLAFKMRTFQASQRRRTIRACNGAYLHTATLCQRRKLQIPNQATQKP